MSVQSISAQPTRESALLDLADLVGERLGGEVGEPLLRRPCDGLVLLSHQQSSVRVPQVYDPVVCVVVQGAKEVVAADRVHPITAGQFLVVTHEMPVASRITAASHGEPYLAVVLSIDTQTLVELQMRIGATGAMAPAGGDGYAMSVGDADIDLVDAFTRCLRATGERDDTDVLLPLVFREIHYRLLTSPHADTLRRLSLGDAAAQSVSKAIALIRRDLTAQIRIGLLAKHVGLSTSALHHHFKTVTGTTPIQYQKQLRLLEARRRLQSTGQSVSEASYAVGYASPSQFSREYRRAFGWPPSQDVGTLLDS